MEQTVDQMLEDLGQATMDAEAAGVAEPLKAVYVCLTNIVEGNAYQTDDPKQPFSQHQALPTVIWGYLVEHHGVEHHGVDPDSIAVYCWAQAGTARPFDELRERQDHPEWGVRRSAVPEPGARPSRTLGDLRQTRWTKSDPNGHRKPRVAPATFRLLPSSRRQVQSGPGSREGDT